MSNKTKNQNKKQPAQPHGGKPAGPHPQRKDKVLLEMVRHAPLKERVGRTNRSTDRRNEGKEGRMSLAVTDSSLLTPANDSAMYKTVNIELSANTISWNGLLFSCLSNITTGATDGYRVGDMIDVREIDLRWELAYGTVNTSACRTGVRVIVFRSAIPGLGVADILRTIGSAYASVSPINEDFLRASEVLHDELVALHEYQPYRVGHFHRRLSMPVLYEGSSGLAFGQLYVLFVSGEDPTDTTYVPGMAAYVQIKYVDV